MGVSDTYACIKDMDKMCVEFEFYFEMKMLLESRLKKKGNFIEYLFIVVIFVILVLHRRCHILQWQYRRWHRCWEN